MEQVDAVGDAEVIQSVDGRAHRDCAGADHELVVLDRARGAVPVADDQPLAGNVDVGGVGVQPELHPGGFEVRVRAVREVAPVRDFTRDVVRDAADGEVRVGVCDHDRHLGGGVELSGSQGRGDAGVAAADRYQVHGYILTCPMLLSQT